MQDAEDNQEALLLLKGTPPLRVLVDDGQPCARHFEKISLGVGFLIVVGRVGLDDGWN